MLRDRLSVKTCARRSKNLYDMIFFIIRIKNTNDSWPEGESQMDGAQMTCEDTEVRCPSEN